MKWTFNGIRVLNLKLTPHQLAAQGLESCGVFRELLAHDSAVRQEWLCVAVSYHEPGMAGQFPQFHELYPHSIPFQFFDCLISPCYPYISIYSVLYYSIFTFFVFLCSAPSVSTKAFGHVFSMSPHPGATSMRWSRHRWISRAKPSTCSVPWRHSDGQRARGPDGRVATWEVTAWSAKMEHGTSYFIQFYQQIIKGKFSDANASIY